MGCDIHLQVEKRVNGRWERVEKLPPRTCSWCDGLGHYPDRPQVRCYWCVETQNSNGQDFLPYHDRNYTVFSVLAGVRNDGYVKPISEPRGLPDDATHSKVEPEYEYGDHSFSWLTLAELLSYDWEQERPDEGWVNAKTFQAWEENHRLGCPDSWCSAVSGGNVQHVTHSDMRRRISEPYPWEAGQQAYTLVQWTDILADRCKNFLAFMEVLEQIGPPDDVRIVFGFDS